MIAIMGLLLLIVLSGCATTPSEKLATVEDRNWKEDVGRLSYAEAAAEYGTPTELKELSDGSKVARWNFIREEKRRGLTVFNTTNLGDVRPMEVAPEIVRQPYRLELKFGPDGLLKDHRLTRQ
ncbi:MAG: hypothetical protein FJ276_30430 [Planctomycetes bacterium]|nr:hypothetical protein [Planctomycetota bacterium]